MKGIMIQGTHSDVGKSYITTAICRFLVNKGFNVAPFKSQNMSNNSFVTHDGLEIGRAQGTQAQAAKVLPEYYMNPILLKPKKDTASEVILNGKVFKTIDGFKYTKEFTLTTGLEEVKKALKIHEEKHDLIVIEGAGSPAEVNLNEREIVNMRIAEAADVDVILVVDIDRGGSFASVVGTLELVFEHRKRIKGIIFNKFRGDINLLKDGLVWLEEYTNIKVLGVLPYLKDIHIETEDAQSEILFEKKEGNIDIAVIHLERVSNNTDIEPFLYEDDVNIRIIKNFKDFKNPDAIIIPGTKSTIDDLLELKQNGLADKIKEYISNDGIVFGICGGFQILGSTLSDPLNVDTLKASKVDGLNIFKIDTVFNQNKQVRNINATNIFNQKISGYEIHLGNTTYNNQPYFSILEDNKIDGATFNNNQVIGTYLHNIFHNDNFRNYWLNIIRLKTNREQKREVNTTNHKELNFDKLAKIFEENIDTDYLMKLITK
ncbi:cobyric acid synthase CobQ [Candidatus Izimaplasma bacterium ZiA1]|uniref:cobyric acid synthase n=1 Tax=Candidatus Izimoplasma sp. ZiA1 TaxID=2024899 RepID=UPI000BAA575B|nr:cobyric acid synthase CobQ [Candidatus Izimaplasma bacterium ZiA1]